MYDPDQDEEEKARKIAQKLFIKKSAQKDLNSTMKPPAIDVPPPAVAAPEVPQTMMDQMLPYLQQFGQNAQGYTQGFTAPGIDPVQRGGGPMQPSSIPMAAYGQGLVSQMGQPQSDDEDKKAKMAEMIMKMMGGG